MTDTVKIAIELSEDEAQALAQFLKRVGHGDYRPLAASDDEAYTMLYAGEKVRDALRDAGYAPR